MQGRQHQKHSPSSKSNIYLEHVSVSMLNFNLGFAQAEIKRLVVHKLPSQGNSSKETDLTPTAYSKFAHPKTTGSIEPLTEVWKLVHISG
jgi:hypothetical protein